MTENRKPESRLDFDLAEQRSLAAMVDASLKRGSGLSIALSDATVGVSLDGLGDWTITVGLSSRSDRFHQSIYSLERSYVTREPRLVVVVEIFSRQLHGSRRYPSGL